MSVAVSHDGLWVASGSKDRSVQFWDLKNSAIAQLQGHNGSGEYFIFSVSLVVDIESLTFFSVISVDFSPAGNILATGSGDRRARICMSSIFVFCFLVTNSFFDLL